MKQHRALAVRVVATLRAIGSVLVPTSNKPSQSSQRTRAKAPVPSLRTTQQAVKWLSVLVVLLLFGVSPVFATGNLSLTVDTTPTTVETGQEFTYTIDFSCAGVTANCGALNISVPYDDTLFDLVTVVVGAGGYTALPGNPVTITKGIFADGDSSQATVVLRAKATLIVGGVVPGATITGTISAPAGPGTVNINTPNITITQPTLQWSVNKTRVLPTATVDPAVWSATQDAYVRYNAQYCSDSPTGNLPVNGAILVDQLPAGAEIRNTAQIISEGGIITGSPLPTGYTITWALDNPAISTDDLLGNVGCITKTVEVEYPDTNGFSAGSVVGNVVLGYIDDDPNGTGICDAFCVGTDTATDTLTDPVGQPNLFKSVADTRPVAHPGNTTFSLSFDTEDVNVPMSNVTLRDDIPLAVSDSRPALDVFQVTAGAWDDDNGSPVLATLVVTFEDNSTQTLPVNGSGGLIDLGTSTSYTAPRAPLPRATSNLVRRVELVFPYVPMGFVFTGAPTIRYTPSLGMVAGDYNDGSGFEQYQNCAQTVYGAPNPTPTGTPLDCADARITDVPTSVTDWSKTASPAAVYNDGIVTFSLNISVGQESSGNLTNPVYTDVLDDVLEFYNFDSATLYTSAGIKLNVNTSNTTGADTLNDPYVIVEPNIPLLGQTRLTFFWTSNPADPRFMQIAPNAVYNSAGGAPVGANDLILTPPASGNKSVTIQFRAHVKPVSANAFAGSYTNNVRIDTISPTLLCPGSNIPTDFCETSTGFSINEVATIQSFKCVRSTLPPTENVRYDREQYNADFSVNPLWYTCPDETVELLLPDGNLATVTVPVILPDGGGDYSRTPCVAQGNPTEGFEYLIQIQNVGNVELEDFVFYDILPYVGDFGVSQAASAQARDSEFMVWLSPTAANKVEVLSPVAWINGTDYIIEYNTSSNPCRPEMTATTNPASYSTAWHAGCNNTWLPAASVLDWRTIRSFRIIQLGGEEITPGQNVAIRVNAYIPTETELTTAGVTNVAANRPLNREVAWNSFAYRFTSATTGNNLLPAEPRKVGIRIPERLSVGNRVWIDDGGTSGNQANVNNRVRNGTELGVDGVTLQLYRWDGGGAVPNLATAPTPGDPTSIAGVTLVAETITANGGYYLFETDQRAAGLIGVNPPETAYDWINNTPIYSLRPDNYFVFAPPTQFDDGADPLFGYVSSTGVDVTATTDNRDRGIDSGVGASTINPTANGVTSNWFNLRFNQTPTGENDSYTTAPAPYGPDGRGTLGQTDTHSDLIRDFGFIQLMSIGNRVWFDTGTATGLGNDIANGGNNGVFDAIEQPVAGVTVRLFRVQQDGAGAPTYTGTTPNIQAGYFTNGTFGNTYSPVAIAGGGNYLETTTDANGYYQFENLYPGNYYVELPSSNFAFATSVTADAVLATYASSTGNTVSDGIANPSVAGIGGTFGDGDDNRDKGIDAEFLQTNGISSPVIHLRPRLTQTITETDLGTRGDGIGVVASNSNLTADFGFYQSPMSLGNRVWRDNGIGTADGNADGIPDGHNDGIQNGTEAGIPDVIVELYYDENGDGIPDNGDLATPVNFTLAAPGAPLQTLTTDANGYYRFDNLRPGRYVVRIAPDNFDGSGTNDALTGLANSTANLTGGNIDRNDDGITPATAPLYTSQGVYSATVQLVPVSEPNHTADGAYTGVAGTEVDLGTGQGTGGDRNTDLTVDFGFYQPSSIGNRIWIDDGTGTLDGNGDGILDGFNNGVQDGNEPNQGIPGVRVELYRDNGNGTFDPATDILVGFDTTDANGYYLFDNLPEVDANYWVFLPPSNFDAANGFGNDPLDRYTNSAGQFTNSDDSNDNGVYFNYPTPNGVVSNIVPITPITNPTGFAPTGETELSGNTDPTTGDGANSRGRFNETDGFSDLTIDFGFFLTPMSLGNRVWRDYNNNAIWDAGEPGIENVALTLYRDNGDNTLTGADVVIGTTTTDVNGYYIFDNLIPANYFVAVTPANFLGGAALENLANSNNNALGYNGADNGVDEDDNGNDVFDATFGHVSSLITLELRTEPINEVRSGNPIHGDPDAPDIDFIGNQLQIDVDSDLTIDFGFYRSSSIGNRVWIDDGAGTIINPDGTNTGINNGVQDNATERGQGVDNVNVQLYRFVGAGDPLTTPFNPADATNFALVRTVQTADDGYYLFDGLPEADAHYYVFIAPDNFTPTGALYHHSKSNPVFDTDADYNNNGDYLNFPVENGVVSNRIHLTPISTGSWSPVTEHTPADEVTPDTNPVTGAGANGRGRYRETDDYSDLTIDFSFFPERLSLGNRIWRDYNNNAIWDGISEPGIAGVTVDLYAAIAGLPSGSSIGTTTTDANGFYIFDNLLPGDYVVSVATSNFASTAPLENLTNSNNLLAGYSGADNGLDQDDNGIDAYNATYGYYSASINLAYRTETITDTERSGNAAHGQPGAPEEDFIGRQQQLDTNSDLTIDFGFYRASSIGNRVWFDTGVGGGTYNDGIQNGNETQNAQGIDGVVMELYRYDGAGVPPVFDETNPFALTDLTLVRTTTTSNGGYYLFDGLPEENETYYVRVAPSNFTGVGVLVDYDNSYPTFDNDTDRNDNGVYTNYPATTGIVSNPIGVTVRDGAGNPLPTDWSPTGEADELSPDTNPITGTGANSRGRFNESDNFSDLTIDFGFLQPLFSLGNRLWYDLNNNGVWDDAITSGTVLDEAGVPNARVFLYQDTNNNGIFNRGAGDAVVRVTFTDSDGYYLFDGLTAGNYFVWVDELNFRDEAPWQPGVPPAAGPLLNYYSSQPTTTTDNDVDEDDNGIYDPNPLDATPVTGGVVSPMITLAKNLEPINETDLSGNPVHDDGELTYRGERRLDSNSNLTIDFGFYKPMSLGNRVWYDTDGDGIIDPLENGIGGVNVELWVDTNGDDVPDAQYIRNSVPYVVTTDLNGWYLFDNLTPGRYIVVIPGSQTPLIGLTSTIDDVGGEVDIDNNDNGVGTTNAPVQSRAIVLTLDGEPTNEVGLGPQGIGSNGEENRNSNVTVDFGFTAGQMSLGNRVWLDPNNNGIQDGAETGIANVRVSLYRDVNGDGNPDGAAIATDTTDANGFYLFGGLAPGNYIVGLDNVNFNAGQPLVGLVSSTDLMPVVNAETSQTDRDDNGLDALNPLYGIITQTVTLTLNAEPTGETDLSNNAADGAPAYRGNNGETDNNSDLTIDFGLFRPMSIGNRVWYDVNNNGLINPGENGVPGTVVELYRSDPSGTPIGAPIATDTTDANGFYLFDRLGTGSYVVVVAPVNFQPLGVLENLDSSTPTFSNNSDNNDNGINNLTPPTNNPITGVRSNLITLVNNGSPTGESNLSGNPADGTNSRGNNGETDNNSNLTIDFGFVPPALSLGNRVWIDDGGTTGTALDGIQNGDEVGVRNVRVSLYRDDNSDGVPDSAAIATTTTNTTGHYLFDNLTPGNYVVGLDASNFSGSAPLVGYGSTLTTAIANGILDQRDNGLDADDAPIDTRLAPSVNGIFSNTVTLALTTEPTGEADFSTPPGIGAGGVDANSNLTVDFGVYRFLSIGNRVWFDTNDSGIQEVGEVGIPNVVVNLYLADPITGLPTGVIIATDTTDAGGYYLFDQLTPNTYVVAVDGANFNAGNALEGMNSSTLQPSGNLGGEEITDRNDNGFNLLTPEGIISNMITLAYGTLPTNDTDTSGNAADGPNFRGRFGEANNNSNLSVDFGFFAGSMSLGNRVWFDDGGTTGTANNGIQDGDEVGVVGVTVQLYADPNGDGVPDGSVLFTTTTDVTGHYLFDNLPPGRYVVVLPPSNFTGTAPLVGYFSSSGNSTNDDDVNDNGIDNPSPTVGGIRSNSIHLIPNSEPTGEIDLGLLGTGANGSDQNSNLTVDFGFAQQYDLSDAPNSYGTDDPVVDNAARHLIIPNLYMGNIVDAEQLGQSSVGADGDDTNPTTADDEDGVVIPRFVVGTTQTVEVTVFNNTGQNAVLFGWVDFDGNGIFDVDSDTDPVQPGFEGIEWASVVVPSSPLPQIVYLSFYVPTGADIATGGVAGGDGSTYARFRLALETATMTPADATGTFMSGEVEDYVVPQVSPPGVAVTKTNNVNAIVAGQSTTYTITIANSSSNSPVTGLNVQDIVDIGPNAFLSGSITWTCDVTIAGADSSTTCLTGQVAPNSAGAGNINEFIDLATGGEVVFRLTATLNPGAANDTVSNTASVAPNGGTSVDIDGIIFDPPNGVKTGQLFGNNVIRWTMVWFNTGAGENATVTDVIQNNQTFNGNLVCTAFGLSTTSLCEYDPVTNTVTWTGFIDNGNPNRVEIAFDVLIGGNGTYNNDATITIGNNEPSVSAGRVRVGDDTPGPELEDPALVKLVDPAFAQPGEVVKWTIRVRNPNSGVNDVIPNVGFTDEVDARLEILGTDNTAGTVTVNGQSVTFLIGALQPLQEVEINILTRVRQDAEVPFIIENFVALNSPYEDINSSAVVLNIKELPATGETPVWRNVALAGLAVVIGGILIAISAIVLRSRRA